MPLLFLILAFFLVFVLSQRSIALGIMGAIGIGYFSGIVRANFQSIATTFFFDVGVFALYLSVFLGHTPKLKKAIYSQSGQFVLILIFWPIFLSLIPINNFYVQLVALRGNVWLLPFLIIATLLKKEDVFVIARGFAILNVIAMVAGVYIYFNGVESLYPINDVTRVIYGSKDVVGGRYRIPSIFLSAHAYGGTMVLTLPFLLGAFAYYNRSIFERALMVAGIAGAISGILFCAARQPIWMLGLIMVSTWVQTGLSPKVGIILALFLGSGLYAMSGNERFQRGISLEVGDGDKNYTFNRIYGSVNEELFDTILAYPLGAGMGTSVGTSIPYFLSDYQPIPIGAENEYSRIAVDQGWVGLGCWLAFLFWSHYPFPSARSPSQAFLLRMLHSTTGLYWATAFIGTGTLTSIPSSAIMLLSMGIIVSQRESEKRHTRLKNKRRHRREVLRHERARQLPVPDFQPQVEPSAVVVSESG